MVAVIDTFFASLTPYFGLAFDVIWQIIQLLGLLAGLGYAAMLFMYNIKVNVREYSKGGRVITYTTRAMRTKDKKTGSPKLRLFGFLGFKGDIINEPPAECLVAHRSRITNKLYDFVKKDGLFYPIENIVLGIRHEVDENVKQEVWNEKKKRTDIQIVKRKRLVYSIEGSGLEVSRDYDAEQAIQTTLIEKATTYRNRKPTEIIASYALMIITIIVSGVVMWFAWKQFGNMAGAIASLGEPLREGIVGAAQGIIGPG